MRRVLVVALLLVAGCGVPQDDAPRALDPEQAPFRVFSTEEPELPGGQGRVALYFVRDDRVVLQTRAVDMSVDVDELVEMLLEGPTETEVAAGTRSALPTTFTIEDVDVGPTGTAVVELGDSTRQASTTPLGFAQVVATLTAPGRARAVRFRLDGEDLPVPRGDGSLTSDPLDRDDYAELLSLATAAPSPAG